MDSVKNKFLKSIIAGFMIGIGGTIYLSLDSRIIGSFLFSFGLITIVIQQLYLYTGIIGYIKNYREIPEILTIIIGNFIGTYIIALVVSNSSLPISSINICQNKLLLSMNEIFMRSVLCGMVMFLAIDGYKKNKNIMLLIIPVMIFILSGYEHSIANMFYFSLAHMLNLHSILYVFIMMLGNGIGAICFGYLMNRVGDFL